ncbi:MAG: transcription elongation factor GreB [Burkholderiales bacterium]|nr:transcription elongation factor GreB [Burkholderiales bacterium]
MNKAFTREDAAGDADDEDDLAGAPPIPAGARNYMTPGGFARLKSELDRLVAAERPSLVATVAWAASNGDRSENGDYLYGKKRLREIDRRIRFLVRRLDAAEVVDPTARGGDGVDQVYFGATVRYATRAGDERTIAIVGIDETDPLRGYVSWISPVARALTRAREGDVVTLRTPGGVEELEVLEVRYEPLATGADAARPPLG